MARHGMQPQTCLVACCAYQLWAWTANGRTCAQQCCTEALLSRLLTMFACLFLKRRYPTGVGALIARHEDIAAARKLYWCAAH